MQDATHDRIIDELYQAHRAAVMRVCSSILRNADDAADATQEVFLIAIESLDPTAKGGAAQAWLLTVARNHCLDLLRRRKRLGKALVTLGPDDAPGRDLEATVADRDFVDIVFKQLSKRERQALWQSAVESRPLADIASGLRLSYMAAAQVLHRARRHAMQAAARVAVALGIFQVGRQRSGTGLLANAQRLAAVAAVPLLVVAMNASSPIPKAASASTTAVAIAATQPTSAVGAPQTNGAGQLSSALGGLPGGGGGSLLPGSTAALNSAANTVDQLSRSLASVSPLAGKPPALPPVQALPSTRPLPSPPASPGVP
ncbi:MAG TPA: sigma-70 family RNA polymerase sigma factor [Candidatus Dormibacteraeota bacterium]|nr:sigma-70 family RNA polymerase sigma factor [Candidatus Dormibacteraeota bacterium]